MSFPFKSKFKGWCVVCKKPINIGDPIKRQNEEGIEFFGKFIHSYCHDKLMSRGNNSAVQKALVTHRPTYWIHECSVLVSNNALYATSENTEIRLLTSDGCPKCRGLYVPGRFKTEVEEQDLSSTLESIEENLAVVENEQDTFQDTKNFVPSKYQEIFFDFVKNGTGHGVLEAVAGSGKTTSIVKALEFTSPESYVGFLAFNKHIAAELKKRSPNHVHVSTIHSLGLSNLRRHFGEVEIDEDKVSGILNKYLPANKNVSPLLRMENRQKRMVMYKLVALSKATLVDFNSSEDLQEMCDRYGIIYENGDITSLFNILPQIMQDCALVPDIGRMTIDYDDMIWLPIFQNIPLEKFDFLFCDESQDLNKCQIRFVLSSIKETGRIICVGDRRQSLYGFRGADTDAIPNIIEALNATVMPLSISYRCPKKIVEHVKDIVPEIEPSETAIDGEILNITSEVFARTVKRGDMVICRTNAPLVEPAFSVIRKGIKAVIRGRDIGKNIAELVERFQSSTLEELDISLGEYFQREYTKLMDRGKEMAAISLKDQVEVIRCFMSECKTPGELVNRIGMIFSDDNEGIVFSSVHRAKGLESENIFILRPDLMPHPKAKAGTWEAVQEMNCLYVARTRSKNRLYYVTD